MIRFTFLLSLVALFLVACGSPIEEKSKEGRAAQEANTAKALDEAGE